MRPSGVVTLTPLLFLGLLQGCDSDGVSPPDPITGLPRDLTLAEEMVIGRSNTFGFDLLKEVDQSRPSSEPNVILSPLSATMALGMALEGADGETFAAMRDALRFQGLSREEITASYRGLLDLLLDLDVLTVSGKKLGEVLDGVVVKDPQIIRPMEAPFGPDGGLTVLRGNLAPDGAIVKKSAVPKQMFTYRGPARVFECEEDAIYSMFNNQVTPGECIIIRYEGPKGGPGMREMAVPAHLLQLLGLGESSALITDGRYSGSNYGMCIGHASPEAADGGALAVVRDGDMIEIDIPNRKLAVKLTDEELEKTLAVNISFCFQTVEKSGG